MTGMPPKTGSAESASAAPAGRRPAVAATVLKPAPTPAVSWSTSSVQSACVAARSASTAARASPSGDPETSAASEKRTMASWWRARIRSSSRARTSAVTSSIVPS